MNEKKKIQLQRVRELAEAGGIKILAHFFQRAEVRAAADFVGGSHEVIERAVGETGRPVMLCGASFMAVEIERRAPRLKLLVPRHDLSCPLAEAVSVEEVLAAKAEYPDALVAVDIKCPPEIRALADLEISPLTARQTLAASGDRGLIVLPGAHLADWSGFGDRVVKRWPRAVCQVHELARPEDLARAQAEHPKALTAVNLLCLDELKAAADFVGDSAGLRRFCAEQGHREFIVVSEAGLAEYLAETLPDKRFYETEAEIYCPNMKLTTLKSMIERLEKFFTS